MRMLVAGGAGFLGSHLTELLLGKGHKVTVVDDLSSGLEGNISSIKDEIDFIRSDVSDYSTNERFDVIINMASRASRKEWETYPVEVALTNSMGNNNLAKLALRDSSLYIYASTSEVYGNPEVVPTPESYVGKVSSTGSRSPYDEGKRFGEALIKSYEREYGLRNIIIRFFNTYGPRMRGGDLYGRVLDRFIEQCLSGNDITVYGDGKQTRSFTYVSDTVSAIDLLLSTGKAGEIYNVGNDIETEIGRLASVVKEITGSSSELKFMDLPPDDPMRRAADISKIRALGWSPTVPLNEGIRIMIEHHS